MHFCSTSFDFDELACKSVPLVQLYACSAIWCVARNEENRIALGSLQACKCLLKLLFSSNDKKMLEWR